jgi:hypothetical protein
MLFLAVEVNTIVLMREINGSCALDRRRLANRYRITRISRVMSMSEISAAAT